MSEVEPPSTSQHRSRALSFGLQPGSSLLRRGGMASDDWVERLAYI